MKHLFFLSLLFLALSPSILYSQEFDEAFIKSLPKDVAADLMDKADEKKIDEEVQYRRPSTFIKKPDPDEESLRFGAKVFSMMQTTLMPLNEPNFDSSYVLDFGDQLELQLIGQKSKTTQFAIKRDGSINIDDIGKVYISGLSLRDATDLIKSKIKQTFIGVEAYISHIGVRDIQIIMAGNVYNPGPYTLSGNSNIFHALSVSGGPSEFGSFRSINLMRNDKKIESIDLYDTFIFGKSNFKTRLKSGDIIFVNPVKNVISVNGAVKRVGEYELLKGENLSSAINFANGISVYADINNLKLERVLDGEIKQIPIKNVSQFNEISSRDGDSIFIRRYPFRSIEVEGAVLNPGNYLLKEGESILDAITKAGGYTKNAYPFGGIYENEDTKELNKMALEKLYENFLDNLLALNQQSSSSDSDFTSTLELTTILKDAEPSGRVVADFVDTNQISPLLVRDGDKIIIPEYVDQVYIYGEVSSEGSAKYNSGNSLKYYLDKKGGLTKNADTKSIYVLSPNGETARISINKNIFQTQSGNIELFPGSVIFVPRKVDSSNLNRMTAQAYATIIGNLGVSLASLSVLKD